MIGHKFTQMLALWVVIGVVIITGSTLHARENRKASSSRSSSKSSGSRRSSGASSQRITSPSRSGISSRPTSRPNIRIPQITTRQSRKTTSSIRLPGTISSARTSRSGVSSANPGSARSGISRKQGGAPSLGRSGVGSGTRVNRKANTYPSYPGYPPTRRSLYHYHRRHYPSHRIFYWITWPNCCRPICYSWGPHYRFGFFWPYYHRKFIFISLGGYWPDYDYRRYYWYGWHPYDWYGYYPPGYVIAGPTYNYYYYNKAPEGEELGEAQQELEEKPPKEPAPETSADRFFDQAVKAFDAGDYATAKQKFRAAMSASPEDIVLPFAYVQALFADGDYQKATEVLREAMTRVSPEQEGVFYPRGLYSDESALEAQIEQLEQTVVQNAENTDLELLLGYQLVGVSRFDEAGGYLHHASLDQTNKQAATALLGVLEKLETTHSTNSESQSAIPAGQP